MLFVVLALSACGGDPPTDSAAMPTPTIVASPSAQPVASPSPSDASFDPGRIEYRFEMVGGPDWMAVTSDAVWVKMDEGTVRRIDPQTNKEVANVRVTQALCQGLGAEEAGVWTCSGTDLVRIDPATNKVVATVKAEKGPVQGELAIGFGHVWVTRAYGKELAGVNTTTNKVDVTIPLKVSCNEVAASRRALWAACPDAGVALRVDPRAAKVTAQVAQLPNARTVSAVGDDVWVGYENGTARIDARSAKVVGKSDQSPGGEGSVLATRDGAWIRQPRTASTDPLGTFPGTFLQKVDRSTFEVVDRINVTEVSGGDVVEAFGSVWATAYNDSVLYRLTPSP